MEKDIIHVERPFTVNNQKHCLWLYFLIVACLVDYNVMGLRYYAIRLHTLNVAYAW